MSNEIQKAFDTIQASDTLKASTKQYIAEQRHKRQGFFHGSILSRAIPAFALLLCLLSIGGYHLLQTPVSYISMDINPSIELSLNRFDRVVQATAFNDDGQLLLDAVSVNGQTYTQAIDNLVTSETMRSYLTEENILTFTVASTDTARERNLISGIEAAEANKNGCQHICRSANADMSLVQQAHQQGLSFGKYAAYLELQTYDNTITVEDCKNMTMREMNDYIGQCKAEQQHHSQNSNKGNNRAENRNGNNGQGHHGNRNNQQNG